MNKRTKAKIYKFLGAGGIVLASFFAILLMLVQSGSRQNQSDVSNSEINEMQKETFLKMISTSAKENQVKYGVLSSITMAQAALESEFGTSQLAYKYYNLFGVKGNESNGVALPTREYYDGKWHTVDAYFKVYKNWQESIDEHGKLLANGTSWNKDQYMRVIQAKNYKEAVQGLVEGGYATDPAYARKLIEIIEKYELNKYDE